MVLEKVLAVALAAEIVLPFVPAADKNAGWNTTDGQSWYYVQENGEFVVDDWVSDGGNWYYLDSSGRMVAGVNNYRINGVGYDFSSSGVCTNPDAASKKLTGWQKMYNSYYKSIDDEDDVVFVEYRYEWYFYDYDGTAVTGWKKIDGKWYCFDNDSNNPYMYFNDEDHEIPFYLDDTHYYFKSNGEMVTGWYKNNGKWYCARPNGELYCCEWYLENGNWYYFNVWSEMYADVENVVIDGIAYSFDSNGVCINPYATAEKHVGWFKQYAGAGTYEWYYYDENGEKVIGWKKINGKWYYLDPIFDGVMAANCPRWDAGEYYCFDDNGELVNGWFKNSYYYGYDWYYCIDGKACKGWKLVNGVWYYFDPDSGKMNSGNILTIGGKAYRFADSGAMYVGWSSYVNKAGTTLWWYSGPDGSLYVNKWLSQGGKWYYFASDAEMVANVEDYEINGVLYDFDENGVCLNP